MFTYLVLEPSIFNGAYYDADPRYGADVERVLRAVHYNGCLLLDANDDLLRRMLTEIATIPPKYRQKVRVLFEELYLGLRGKKRVVTCAAHLANEHGRDSLRIVASLLVTCGADAAVAPVALHDTLRKYGAMDGTVTQPADYEDSVAEALRMTFLQPCALNHLNVLQVGDLFRRVFRFSRWLRIYDKQIGKGGNTSGFREGIDFVLGQWTVHSHEPLAGAKVEIVTAVQTAPGTRDTQQQKRATRAANAERILLVEDAIVAPLRRKYSFDLSLEVREDPERQWHARFYETNIAVLKLDPGADILKRTGGFKQVYLDHAERHSADLATIYNLPRITYASDGRWRLGA